MLSDKIGGVVSIGASARYDYSHSPLSLPGVRTTYSNPLWIFGNAGLYEPLAANKKLVVSIGTDDAGGWGRDGENKFSILHDLQKRQSGEAVAQ